MENNRLNINRPLLSVRRYPSITASQKNENRKNENSLESCATGLKFDPMMNTGSVPFVWEHSPGRPKKENNKPIQTKENPPGLPKLPPGRFLKHIKKDAGNLSEVTNVTKRVSPIVENITRFESRKPTKNESSDSGVDDDEDFMDALDTLSRGDTSFYNCSASGVSGFGSDMKPSGIRSSDPKMNDFMMGRFLPAAKAMASDVPQHTSLKQFFKERPLEVKKTVNMDQKNLQPLRYGPNFLQDVDHDNDEDEDTDYEYDEHGKSSSKFCGLLPRFCSNPANGMSMRSRLPMSPANKTLAIASSSSISSFSETENEPSRTAIYEYRSLDKSNIAKNQEDLINYQKLQGLGLYNRLQGSFQSSVSVQKDFCSQKKGSTIKELLADKNKIVKTKSQDSIVEKTLYVDTVHPVISPTEKPSPPSTKKAQSNFKAYDTDKDKDTDKLHKSCESLKSDTISDEPKHNKKTEIHKDFDQDFKVDQERFSELLAPPPLPQSPSDSWLSRTLPSVSSKQVTPMRRNPKSPSSNPFPNDPKPDENIQLPYKQGPLFPIPEN